MSNIFGISILLEELERVLRQRRCVLQPSVAPLCQPSFHPKNHRMIPGLTVGVRI